MGSVEQSDMRHIEQSTARIVSLLPAFLIVVRDVCVCDCMCVLVDSVTAGNSDQIQACLDGDLLSIVIDLLIANEDEEVSNECSHALANSLTGGTVEQICRLVSHSSLALVALNVSLASSKESVVRVSVDALHRVMRAGDELLAGVVDTDALSHELRDLVFAGEHPFAELVAGACRSNLCALKNSHDEEIADNARDILDR